MCNVHGVIWYWCQKPTGFPKCARFRSNTIVDNLLFEKFLQILNFLKNKYEKESILPPMYMDYSGHISLETLWGMYSIFFLLLLLLPNDICKWKMSTIFFKKRIQIFYISINFRIHFCMCEKNHPNSSNYRQYTTNNVISSYILLGWLFAAYFKGI